MPPFHPCTKRAFRIARQILQTGSEHAPMWVDQASLFVAADNQLEFRFSKPIDALAAQDKVWQYLERWKNRNERAEAVRLWGFNQ